MIQRVLCSVLLVVVMPHLSNADNWAHWRGPTGNGVAPDARPPLEWSSTKNVKWKTAIPGRSSGSPVVWEDRVFVVTAVPAEGRGNVSAGVSESAERAPPQPQRPAQPGRRPFGVPGGSGGGLPRLAFKTLCFDRQNGDLLWEQTATVATPHQGTHPTHGYASASPCTDGKHVFAHFGSRGLYCYRLDGQLVWKRDDFGKMETRNSFGEGSSPTLAGDKILVPWDHEGPSYLYALNKLTGETIWKTPRDEPSCWATPLVVAHQGAKQVIMNGQSCARAYDLDTGEEIWRCGGQAQRPVASAVGANGLVFIGSGFQGSFLGAFRLDGRGDIAGTDQVVWTLDHDTPDIASPLLTGERLYFYKGKTGLLSCLDAATGKPHYMAERLPGIATTYASPLAAFGHVYLTDRSGTTVVIKDSDRLEIVASNSLGEGVDATPAPVDNELFVRGENHLFCIAE